MLLAVSFYNSSINIFNSKFIDSFFLEDSLNLVRSPFFIDNVTFQNSISDALDLDFSNGKNK